MHFSEAQAARTIKAGEIAKKTVGQLLPSATSFRKNGASFEVRNLPIGEYLER